MPSRVAITNLNARTIDILNTIRANASYEYQNLVPSIDKEIDKFRKEHINFEIILIEKSGMM